MNLTSAGRTSNSGNRGPSFTPVFTKLTDDANVTVLSFDISVAKGAGGFMQIPLKNSKGVFSQFNGDTSLGGFTIVPELNKWYNVRLEYYNAQDLVQVYRDGIHLGDITAPSQGSAIADLGDVVISAINLYNANGAIDVSYDNIAFYATTKTYEQFPQADHVVESFENENYVKEEISWEFSSSCSCAESHYGTMHADQFTFDSGIVVTPTTGTNYANVAGSTTSIVEADGNKYLSLVANARVCTRDRAQGMKITPQQLSASWNATVFETDLCFTGSSFNVIVYNTANKYAQFNSTTGGDKLGDLTIGTSGEWTSIRIEMYQAEKVAQLYVKNAEGEYEYVGDLAANGGGDLANLDTNVRDVSMSVGGAGTLLLDNVALYTANLTYVDHSAAAE